MQRDRQHLRINAQLIDAATDAHLWAKRFDRQTTGLFAIQDEVVETIVAELAAKLDLVERDRARRKTSESLSAYDLWLQARDYLYRNTKEDNTGARLLLERAVALDPATRAMPLTLRDRTTTSSAGAGATCRISPW